MDHSDNYNNHRQQENLGVCAAEPLLLRMRPDGAFLSNIFVAKPDSL